MPSSSRVAGQTVGIGAGQMSRVDSVKIAVMKAQLPLAGSVVASDAFFPFPDGVEEAGKAGRHRGNSAGGSVRDADVIAAADAMEWPWCSAACGILGTKSGPRSFKADEFPSPGGNAPGNASLTERIQQNAPLKRLKSRISQNHIAHRKKVRERKPNSGCVLTDGSAWLIIPLVVTLLW